MSDESTIADFPQSISIGFEEPALKLARFSRKDTNSSHTGASAAHNGISGLTERDCLSLAITATPASEFRRSSLEIVRKTIVALASVCGLNTEKSGGSK